MAKPFKPSDTFKPEFLPHKFRNPGHAVSKQTLVSGRRIAGALRAEQQRQQKRKDSR